MPIDSRGLLDEIAKESVADRSKASIYLSKSLYHKFKKACGKTPAYLVLERLMRDFIAGLSSPPK